MRVLLANYRYFVSGGPERYLFGIQSALESSRHAVIPFSVRYARNKPTPFAPYFVPPLAGADAIYFKDQDTSPRAIWKTLERSLYSREVRRAVERLVRDTRPDIAYVLHYLKKLSPALLVGIKSSGIPLVVRISDYLMVCPNAHCIRDNRPCELCLHGNLWPSVAYRCVQGSRTASLVHLLATAYHRHRGYFDLIDRFVLTNDFMRAKMIEAGWPEKRMVVIPTFAGPDFFRVGEGERQGEGYWLYVGHVQPHKGPDQLIRAYARALRAVKRPLPRLVMAGGGRGPFADECRRLAAESLPRGTVEWRDFVEPEQMPALFRNAMFTILPARWYENLPNAMLESFAAGTPVLGPAHGSMAAAIREGQNGLTFKPGDEQDIANRLLQIAESPAECRRMGDEARRIALQAYTMDVHTHSLIGLFESLRGR
jgi:glycosyltransferase involved in cell wall biosynthesis